jgi:hypothetical protein
MFCYALFDVTVTWPTRVAAYLVTLASFLLALTFLFLRTTVFYFDLDLL